MIALLKSDLHRMVRSRWPWAVLALVALATLGSALLTIWLPLEAGLVYDGLTGTSGAFRLAGHGSSIGLVIMVAPFVAAHLSTADSDTGFDRTLLSSLCGHGVYFVEKCLFTAVLTAALLVAYLVFSWLGVLVTMRPVTNVEPLWQVAAWAGEAWLVGCTYALVVLLAGQLSRSRALAFSLSFFLVASLAEQLLFSGLLFVSNVFDLGWHPALESAFAWAPYVTMDSIEQGAAAMLAADSTGVVPALRALVVCAPLCLACAAASAAAGSRRDAA